MAELLIEVRNRTFLNEIVVLDDKAFYVCTLNHCQLLYHGGPVTFQETNVIGCSWLFGGPAQRTISLFQFFNLDPRDHLEPENSRVS